jgi:hypothetical protein
MLDVRQEFPGGEAKVRTGSDGGELPATVVPPPASRIAAPVLVVTTPQETPQGETAEKAALVRARLRISSPPSVVQRHDALPPPSHLTIVAIPCVHSGPSSPKVLAR